VNRTREILTGTAALLGASALLVGVPVLLAAGVGWPLPHGFPRIDDAFDALAGRTPIDASVCWRAMALVMWCAWLQLAVAVTLEARAVATGRLAAGLPGLRRAQSFAAALVATIALLWPTSSTTPAAQAQPAAITAPPPPPVMPAEPRPLACELAPIVEHLVVRHDTLWDLADRYLGDGQRWEEIFNANRGRFQPGGDSLDRPSLLRPGWTLQIPVDGRSTTDGMPARDITVEAGDTLSALADEYLGDQDLFPELFAANVGRPQQDGTSLHDPDLIRPGWTLRVPADESPTPLPAEEPVSQPPEPVPALPPRGALPAADETTTSVPQEIPGAAPESRTTERTGQAAGADRATGAAEGEDDVGLDATILGVAGAVLATGVGALLARRRRLQQIRRAPGHAVNNLPAPAAPPVDVAIALADTNLAANVDGAIRALAARLADAERVPRPRLAQVYDDRLELLMHGTEAVAPEGWQAVADGRVWSTPLGADGHVVPGPDRTRPLPTLVAIGALGDGGVLLDLESEGVVGVTGPLDQVSDLVRSIATELAVTPHAVIHSVALVGMDVPGEERLGIASYASVAAALDAVRPMVETVADGMERLQASSSFELRCRYPDEAWPPVTVIVDARTAGGDDALQELVALPGGGGCGLAVVVAGGAPAGALEVRVNEEELEIPDLGLRCRAQLLSVEASDSLGAALDSAAQPAVPAPQVPLTLFADLGDEHRDADDVMVRVLGAIDAEHIDGPIKPQQLALLAYLAVHPDATGDALRDAVRAGRPPTQERFLNSIHELRRALGQSRLPAAADGRYRLVHVSSDLGVFRSLVSRVDADPDTAVIHLQAALELVSGRPFTYDSRHRRNFTWVDLGNHTSSTERLVGDTAHRLSTAALEDGGSALAAWAAHQGLLASPGNEALVGDVMAAHLAAGDPRAAESVLAEYERVLEELGVDGGAEALYELLERRRAS
jgi:LysM repeat protein